MTTPDYKALFSENLYQIMGETFADHGIEYITEEELEDIVKECYRKVYYRSIADARRMAGMSTLEGVRFGWGT